MPRPIAISLRIEVAPAARSESGLEVDEAATTAVAVTVAAGSDPPTGEVQLGTLRWRFINRVQMLDAIDAACEEAIRSR